MSGENIMIGDQVRVITCGDPGLSEWVGKHGVIVKIDRERQNCTVEFEQGARPIFFFKELVRTG